MYGFRRITKGIDKDAYYHELFLRGKLFLCERMLRVSTKGLLKRKEAEFETKPDFYQMPYLPYYLSEVQPRPINKRNGVISFASAPRDTEVTSDPSLRRIQSSTAVFNPSSRVLDSNIGISNIQMRNEWFPILGTTFDGIDSISESSSALSPTKFPPSNFKRYQE